jgi:hypothetical protein
MPEDTARWTVSAVRWRVLDQTIAETRSRCADLPADELQGITDEAVAAMRQQSIPNWLTGAPGVDTNILVGTLLSGTSLPARLIGLWREGGFDLLALSGAARRVDTDYPLPENPHAHRAHPGRTAGERPARHRPPGDQSTPPWQVCPTPMTTTCSPRRKPTRPTTSLRRPARPAGAQAPRREPDRTPFS